MDRRNNADMVQSCSAYEVCVCACVRACACEGQRLVVRVRVKCSMNRGQVSRCHSAPCW